MHVPARRVTRWSLAQGLEPVRVPRCHLDWSDIDLRVEYQMEWDRTPDHIILELGGLRSVTEVQGAGWRATAPITKAQRAGYVMVVRGDGPASASLRVSFRLKDTPRVVHLPGDLPGVLLPWRSHKGYAPPPRVYSALRPLVGGLGGTEVGDGCYTGGWYARDATEALAVVGQSVVSIRSDLAERLTPYERHNLERGWEELLTALLSLVSIDTPVHLLVVASCQPDPKEHIRSSGVVPVWDGLLSKPGSDRTGIEFAWRLARLVWGSVCRATGPEAWRLEVVMAAALSIAILGRTRPASESVLLRRFASLPLGMRRGRHELNAVVRSLTVIEPAILAGLTRDLTRQAWGQSLPSAEVSDALRGAGVAVPGTWDRGV